MSTEEQGSFSSYHKAHSHTGTNNEGKQVGAEEDEQEGTDNHIDLSKAGKFCYWSFCTPDDGGTQEQVYKLAEERTDEACTEPEPFLDLRLASWQLPGPGGTC